ncbi:MAG: PilZ domain-containing protein [Acidobacteria bacterium]|nr:PilZ domain-containing protein [Acidobacteriota bacterium]
MIEIPDDEATVTTRSFARVNDELPVRLRVLTEDQATELARALEQAPTYCEHVAADPLRRAPGATWEQAALASILDRLERLEAIVDRIAERVGAEGDEQGNWLDGNTVALSGSGLGLWATVRIPDGTPIELELSLPGDPSATVRALGRIVTLILPDGDTVPVGRFHLGVAFEAIHEQDREAIVRYTFRVQRAQLRS